MSAPTYSFEGRIPAAVCMASIALALALFLFPLETLISERNYNAAMRLLDDEATPEYDIKPIPTLSMTDYFTALERIESARRFSPQNAFYYKKLAELHIWLARWSEIMGGLGEKGGVTGAGGYEKATGYLKEAVFFEPANPEHHLLLARVYDTMGDRESAETELKRAVMSYPVNAPLRYEVARHYLLTKRYGDAIEHSRALAVIDTSYMAPLATRETGIIERRSERYLSRLYRSYLFSAFEIAWRASKDKEVVRGITPDNPEAKEVMAAFFEWRGLD
ncbi:MAG: hypothetical protein HY883_04570 [Deltaproteobacteria bacterium]|nr:hypothetical protein [Deltaproteobacteria bacterium]